MDTDLFLRIMVLFDTVAKVATYLLLVGFMWYIVKHLGGGGRT